MWKILETKMSVTLLILSIPVLVSDPLTHDQPHKTLINLPFERSFGKFAISQSSAMVCPSRGINLIFYLLHGTSKYSKVTDKYDSCVLMSHNGNLILLISTIQRVRLTKGGDLHDTKRPGWPDDVLGRGYRISREICLKWIRIIE